MVWTFGTMLNIFKCFLVVFLCPQYFSDISHVFRSLELCYLKGIFLLIRPEVGQRLRLSNEALNDNHQTTHRISRLWMATWSLGTLLNKASKRTSLPEMTAVADLLGRGGTCQLSSSADCILHISFSHVSTLIVLLLFIFFFCSCDFCFCLKYYCVLWV